LEQSCSAYVAVTEKGHDASQSSIENRFAKFELTQHNHGGTYEILSVLQLEHRKLSGRRLYICMELF